MIRIMFETLLANVAGARVLSLGTGEMAFRQGEPARAIFQVRDGSVALVRHLADGALLTLATATSGQTFAEASLFAERYHCDAIARSKSEVLVVPSDALRGRLAANPDQAIQFAEFLAGQVRELRARLEIQRIKKAPERLLAWLRWRAQGKSSFQATDAWSRVASELALSQEALYRALSALEKAGHIRRQGRKLELCSGV